MLTPLNFALIEDDTIITASKNKVVPKNENTECNTIVMIFIGSVLFLALMDSMK